MKACPIVLRNKNGHLEILILEHPRAGFQLAKGTIEKGESIKEACERELFEESGIVAAANKNLGTWTPGYHGQVWGFYQMHYVKVLPESWAHDTLDDGGLTFKFSWRRLDYTPTEKSNWHPLFINAFKEVRNRLSNSI